MINVTMSGLHVAAASSNEKGIFHLEEHVSSDEKAQGLTLFAQWSGSGPASLRPASARRVWRGALAMAESSWLTTAPRRQIDSFPPVHLGVFLVAGHLGEQASRCPPRYQQNLVASRRIAQRLKEWVDDSGASP
jgi:hypothetical protein